MPNLKPKNRLNLDDRPPRISKKHGGIPTPDDPEYWEEESADAGDTKQRDPIISDSHTSAKKWSPGEGRFLPTDSRDWTWTPLHHALIESDAFTSLSMPELQVLLHLMKVFDGYNNGKLTATLKGLRETFKWGDSSDTLKRAIDGLSNKKLIKRTRNRLGAAPNLYELTWLRNRPPSKRR